MKKALIISLGIIILSTFFLFLKKVDKKTLQPINNISLDKKKRILPLLIPDSKRIVLAQGKSIWMWDTQSNTLLKKMEGSRHNIFSLTISSSGKQLVSGGGLSNSGMKGELNFWNLLNNNREKHIETGEGAIYTLSNYNDKYVVAGQENGEITLWNFSTKELFKSFMELDYEITSVLSVPDYDLIIFRSSNSVHLLNIETGHKIKIDMPSKKGLAMSYSHKFKILVTDNQDSVCLWDINSRKKIRCIDIIDGKNITAILFHPNKKIVIAATIDGSIMVFNVEDGSRKYFEAHEDYISDILFSQDGEQVISSGYDGVVKIWNFGDINSLNFEQTP